MDPVFVQYTSRYQGQKFACMTTAGRVEGVLAGVAVDHIHINVRIVRYISVFRTSSILKDPKVLIGNIKWMK
nr:DUF2642 domain-containing protein [Paenibacillus shirakamiensis]